MSDVQVKHGPLVRGVVAQQRDERGGIGALAEGNAAVAHVLLAPLAHSHSPQDQMRLAATFFLYHTTIRLGGFFICQHLK